MTRQVVTINETELQVIEYRAQRVVTLAQVDTVHDRPEGTAGRNFREHRERLIEGEDFYIASSDEIRRNNPKAIPSAVRRNDVVLLTESGYLMLVKSFTDDLAWDVQRNLVRSYFNKQPPKPSAPRGISRSQVAASILLLRSAAEDLKLAPSAVLGGYQRLEAQIGVVGLIPAYAVDAPANSASGSSEETKALGELLEQFGVGISAIAFNRLLVQHGFVEERERPSSKGGVKKYKVCTDLEYGKNLTGPNNPRETQPHWYVSKFQELLDLVLPEKPRAVA
ncbi:MAG: ORF6N domain-containing protein [Hydrogenophaga sp.]|uniref:ORF6N domain-containing protein n=1 Tax=Hydrogenophaga sp. TaxID=1904254 RepID=UPI00273338B7|nr:ORF6N domain-containing protein [Hydrogenophaga sp.]MDP3627112.1 ORF6N domain-containing protein [Hydrogenophaga sp.]